jgi:MFS transporter, FSR family, fosmidomycin resistance protein
VATPDTERARERSSTLSHQPASLPSAGEYLSPSKPSFSEGFIVEGNVRPVHAGVDSKGMAALSSGHLATDLAQGSLPALLPFLTTKFDLSYTMVGALVLAATISSSIIQPAFGFWSDARGALWLLPAGVAVAGIGIGFASIAPSYALVMLGVLASGLGVAAYHPEGSKFASYVSGRRRASGMSLFSVGGNIGFAIGPLLASFFVITLGLGLEGGVFVAVPGLIVATMLVVAIPHLARFAPDEVAQARRNEVGNDWRGTWMLLAIVGLRSLAHMGLFTFIPLYEISRGESAIYGTRLLSLFLFAGAIGTLLGGPLADRVGRRRVLLGSFIVSPPLIATYVLVGGSIGVIALFLAGMAVIGTFSVSLVMSQEYMPGRVGMASGLSIGLAIGLGGVAAIGLGAVADAVDLEAAVLTTALGPAVCIILTLLLPAPRVRLQSEPEPAAASL